MTRGFIASLSIGLAIPWSAMASVDICSDPSMQSRLAFEYVTFEESSFDEMTGTVDLQYYNYDLLFTSGDDKYLFGAGHRYNVFDINRIEPETNGHLHTIFFPFHRMFGDEKKNFRLSIAPAISASSNVVNKPDEYTTDALQLLAALVWGRQINQRATLRYGICGDHRFGEYQIYPTASVLWQPRPDWGIQLGFPESKFSYQISKSLSSEIRIAPDGNEWYVLDSGRTSDSQYVYEALTIEWEFAWDLMERIRLSASVGQQFNNRYEFTLLDRSHVHLIADRVMRIGISFAWRF